METKSLNKIPVLIVDDVPESLDTLKRCLLILNRNSQEWEIEILTADRAKKALEILQEKEVALVLLDVQMPEMDGFEMATIMHQDEKLRKIPVIFVTAMGDAQKHINQGYEAGAVDYLFKPVNLSILNSKVRVFCELFHKNNVIEKQLFQIEEINTELILQKEALKTRNQALEHFTEILSNNLCQPLREMNVKMHQLGCASQDQFNLVEIKGLAVAGEFMGDLIEGMLGYLTALTREEYVEEIVISEEIEKVLGNLTDVLEDVSAQVEMNLEVDHIMADPIQFRELFRNILMNSICYREKSKALKIQICSKVEEENIIFSVSDNGIGIDPVDYKRVFGIFERTDVGENCHKGLGLGLTICKRIVKNHQGKIWLNSLPELGTTIYFILNSENKNI